jgi:hypothetical protein
LKGEMFSGVDTFQCCVQLGRSIPGYSVYFKIWSHI